MIPRGARTNSGEVLKERSLSCTPLLRMTPLGVFHKQWQVFSLLGGRIVSLFPSHQKKGPDGGLPGRHPSVCKQFRLGPGTSWWPISASCLAQTLATESMWPLVFQKSEVSWLWFCRPSCGRVHLRGLIAHPSTRWPPVVVRQMVEA